MTGALVAIAGPSAASAQPPERLDAGRFTFVAYPADLPLARALLHSAQRTDTFPGLPRPSERVLVLVAPDRARFHEWSGPSAPEWGAAVADPAQHVIVMQGRWAGSAAGDPAQVLRHELAHLALHEQLGDLPPRWFHEGYASYAAHEWGRDAVLATSVHLLTHGAPALDSLDRGFAAGEAEAGASYALAFRAVAELAALDRERGLALFFQQWRATGSMDGAVRSAYGLTLADFEHRWRSHTMRRYGILALLGNASVAAGIIALLVFPLYAIRRRRDRLRWEALRQSDEEAERQEAEADRRARDEALAQLLGGGAAVEDRGGREGAGGVA
ncbi:MAG TPA: hypothetical protein VFK13_00735 [Gemmatimonadaceae bacterium]|nr:hypothetical protein [Gemmatimonadaceae bacterium]